MASFTVLSALSLSPQVNTVPALSTITIVNKTPAPNTLLPTLSTPNLMQTSVPAVYATYSYATQGKLSASSAIAPIKQQSQTVGGSVQDSDIFRSLVFNALILLCILLFMLSSFIAAKRLGFSKVSSNFFLKRGAQSCTVHPCRGALPPAVPTSRLQARLRGMYNQSFLRTVPWTSGLTVGQCLVIITYFAMVLVTPFAQTGDVETDALRSGRIAVAQLPIVFALAAKNSPLSVMLGKSYEKLNFLHRFAGRAVFVCSTLHSLVYINKLSAAKSVNLAKPVQLTGFVAWFLISFMLLTSLQPVRRAAYSLFLYSHVIGWIGFIIAIYMHAPWIHHWIYAVLVLVAFDFGFRAARTRVATATLVPLSSARQSASPLSTVTDGTTQIRIDGLQSGWKAGQHVWIRRAGWRVHDAHPFTIASSAAFASLYQSDTAPGLTLYAKSAGDWTHSLHEQAQKTAQEAVQVKLTVQGPYGLGLNAVTNVESLMLIAGGSGITYALSCLEEILASSLSASPQYVIQRVNLIYIVPRITTGILPDGTYGMIDPIIRRLGDIVYIAASRSPISIQVDVWESKAEPKAENARFKSLRLPTYRQATHLPVYRENEASNTPVNDEKGYNAWRRDSIPESLMSVDSPSDDSSHLFATVKEAPACGLEAHSGRPDLTLELDAFLQSILATRGGAMRAENLNGSAVLAGGVGISACGPPGLVTAARDAARLVNQNVAFQVGGIIVDSQKFGW